MNIIQLLTNAFKKKWFNVQIDKWNLLEYAITHYFWQYTTINQSGINWTSNLFMWLIMTKKFGCICHIQGTRPLISNKLAANFALFFCEINDFFSDMTTISKNSAYQCPRRVWKLGLDIEIHLVTTTTAETILFWNSKL